MVVKTELQVSQRWSICRDTCCTSSTVNSCKNTWVLLNFHLCSCRDVSLFPLISSIMIREHWESVEDVSFQSNTVELKHIELAFSLWIFRISQGWAILLFEGKTTVMTIINIIKSSYDDGTPEPQSGLKYLLPFSASYWGDIKLLKIDVWQKKDLLSVQCLSSLTCFLPTLLFNMCKTLWPPLRPLMIIPLQVYFLHKAYYLTLFLHSSFKYILMIFLQPYFRDCKNPNFLLTCTTGSPFSLSPFLCSSYSWGLFCLSCFLILYFPCHVHWTRFPKQDSSQTEFGVALVAFLLLCLYKEMGPRRDVARKSRKAMIQSDRDANSPLSGHFEHPYLRKRKSYYVFLTCTVLLSPEGNFQHATYLFI